MPEFYMIFARKVPEFYIIPKNIFSEFWEHVPPPPYYPCTYGIDGLLLLLQVSYY